MRLRIRGPGGQSAVELADTATILDLLILIEKETTIQSFDIKVGYPPRPFATDNIDLHLPLAHLETPLKNETLIISPKSDQASKPTDLNSRRSEALSQQPTAAFSFAGVDDSKTNSANQIGLTKKTMSEVPELPLLDRGATLGASSISD
jgi:ubiquitin thioesterase OTU1